MSSEEDNNYDSDDEVDKKQHCRLIQDIIQLDKKQYVKKPTRTEPTLQVSEFNLVQSGSHKTSTIDINDLTKLLEKKKKHSEIGKKIKSAQKKVRTLPKPLEKPQREQIKRSIGFKEVKLDLAKWDPIVIKNRVVTQQHFPLNDGGKIYMNEKKSKNKVGFTLSMKTDLDKELEAIEDEYKPPAETKDDEIENFPLTLKEIMEKRREMARLRAHQSYQEAKAYRQNKIKSKKFHRIKRQEKIKNQIKEFEKLQKTDPEEALRKLEELDKTRAEERMSLRHRSTGQWAKNKQVRAKYDKESRQILAEQLALSRQLTQKTKCENESSSESDNELETISQSVDPLNPWVNMVKTETEIDDFLSGYRKYWNEKNEIKNENLVQNKETTKTLEEKNITLNGNKFEEKVNKINTDVKKKTKKKITQSKLQTKKLKNNTIKCTSEWKIQSLTESQENEEQVEEMFNELESVTTEKVKSIFSKLKKELNEPVFKTKQKIIKPRKTIERPNKKKSKTKNFMELPLEKKRPIIDEELISSLDDVENSKMVRYFPKIEPEKSNEVTNIDPNKFLNVQPTNLDTLLPDNVIFGNDNEDFEVEKSQKELISEAFEGDDVVAEFQKEKKDAIEKDQPKDIDMTLPGWGSWGGKNIKPSKRKTRRFLMKFPKKIPRRDENKGNLILYEHKNENMKKHLVSEVPFPFKTVKDFEASIRAPIGDTFVPQTAFRRLIKPSIITKKGEVIKPMDEDVLLKYKLTKSEMVVKQK